MHNSSNSYHIHAFSKPIIQSIIDINATVTKKKRTKMQNKPIHDAFCKPIIQSINIRVIFKKRTHPYHGDINAERTPPSNTRANMEEFGTGLQRIGEQKSHARKEQENERSL